jgi:hypothetical protein
MQARSRADAGPSDGAGVPRLFRLMKNYAKTHSFLQNTPPFGGVSVLMLVVLY